jgi:hypothetical protein
MAGAIFSLKNLAIPARYSRRAFLREGIMQPQTGFLYTHDQLSEQILRLFQILSGFFPK